MGERVTINNRLLDHLVQNGLLSEVELRSAAARQKEIGGELVDVLLEARLIGEVDLARGLASFFRFPLVNLGRIRVTKQALLRATGEFCRRQQILPFGLDKSTGELQVALSDPGKVTAIDALRFQSGQEVKPYVAPRSQLRDAIEFYYYGSGATGAHSAVKTSSGRIVQSQAAGQSSSPQFSSPESTPSMQGDKLAGLDLAPLAEEQFFHDGAKEVSGLSQSRPGDSDIPKNHHRLGQLNSIAVVAEPSGVINDLESKIKHLKGDVGRLEAALRKEIQVSQALAEILVENGLISAEHLKGRLRRG